MPDAQPPAPQGVPTPAPVRTAFSVSQATGPDGNTYVVMVVTTAQGSQAYWLPPETAKALGGNLVRLGGAGRVLLAQGLNGAGGGA